MGSSSSSRPPELGNTGGDGGVRGGSSSGGGDADAPLACGSQDGGCNALQNCGAKVYVTESTATDAALPPAQWQEIDEGNANPTESTDSGTVTFTGTGLGITFTCPSNAAPFSATYTYSQASSSLLMYTPFVTGGVSGTTELTYLKQ